MTASVRKRRKPKGDTARAKAKRACDRHLNDLRRAHNRPPADAAVSMRGLPKLVPPILEQSYCTSPAALCAELAAEPSEDIAVPTRSAPKPVAPILERPRRAAPAAPSAELADLAEEASE